MCTGGSYLENEGRQLSAYPITVLFRYDDYSEFSATEVETRLIATFEKFKVSCLFGVIPFPVDETVSSTAVQTAKLGAEKTAILQDALRSGAVEAALHGYSHQNLAPKGARPTEFSGVTFDMQLQRLAEAKRYMEETLSTPVRVFVPPWNSYDLNTIRALETTGFEALSAGVHIGSAYRENKLKFIPNTGGLLDLKQAVEQVRLANAQDGLIVIMLHPYDFHESGASNSQFDNTALEETLAWLKNQPDVSVVSFQSLLASDVDLSARRYIENRAIQKFRVITPLSLRRYGIHGVYASFANAIRSRWSAWMIVFIFYAGILALSFLSGFGAASFIRVNFVMNHNFLLFGAIVAMIGSAIYISIRSAMHYRKSIFLAIALGVCSGLVIRLTLLIS